MLQVSKDLAFYLLPNIDLFPMIKPENNNQLFYKQ